MSAVDPRLAEIEAAANLIAERLAVAEPAVVEAVVGDSLTDEELAKFEEEWNAGARFSGTIARWSPEVHRLIAALRAERAEVERLTKQCVALKSYRHDYPEATAERDALRSGGERLRSDRDSWKRMYDIAKARADRSEAEVGRRRGEDADAIARGAELARAFNAVGRPEMSGDLASSDAAGGVAESPSAAAPSATPETPKVVDLMEALEASLAAVKAERTKPFQHVWTCGLKFGDPTCECEAFSRS